MPLELAQMMFGSGTCCGYSINSVARSIAIINNRVYAIDGNIDSASDRYKSARVGEATSFENNVTRNIGRENCAGAGCAMP